MNSIPEALMKITVITITYNAARTLQRTLDSVSAQTFTDIEHLIVDGASTDGTLPLARAYQQKCTYPVVVQSEPDKGLYDAMNKGLQLASGDYLVFLNAGDALHAPDTLEIVASHLSIPNSPLPAVVYGDTAITDTEGRFLHLRRHRPPEVLTWRSFRQGMLVCHQAFYARTDLVRNIPYDLHYRHSADVDWCIRVMKEAERRHLRLVNAHAVLADFEEGGDTTQHHRDSLRERFCVMRRHYGLCQTIALHAWFVIRAVLQRLRLL